KELLSEKMKPKNKDDLEQGLLNKKLKILNDGMNIVKVSELFLSIDIRDKIALLVKISVQPTSVVRNRLGKEQVLQDSGGPITDEALWEYCDKNYHQILLIIAEKVHQEKVQKEKLKAVKACLNFEETSRHFESGTLRKRKDLKERLGPRHARSSVTRRRVCPYTRETQGIGHTTVAAETLKATTRVPAPERQNLLPKNIIKKEYSRKKWKHCQKVKVAQEDIGSQN
ncbi:hypothetical protein Tco_1537078, partial [Tanacetum coccineum]